VDTPVAELAVGVVEELAEPLGMDRPIEWTHRRGAAPQIPVEPGGRLRIGRRLAWPARVVNKRAHHADLARPAVFQKLHAGDVVG